MLDFVPQLHRVCLLLQVKVEYSEFSERFLPAELQADTVQTEPEQGSFGRGGDS